MTHSLIINPTAFESGLEAAFNARSRINETQGAAFERFAQLRLPHRRLEGWKWSDFNAALRDGPPAGLSETALAERAETISPSAFAGLEPIEFRIINGRIEMPDAPAPEGMRYGVMNSVGTIQELESHPIASLNVAMTAKSLGIEIHDGVAAPRPILIRHIDRGGDLAFTQSMLRLGKGASVRLFETWEGDGASLSSHLCHLVIRDDARLDRVVLHENGPDAVAHSMFAAKMEARAALSQTSLTTGGRLSRHETLVHFWGAGARADINSAALLAGRAHADFTTHVVHKQPDCAVRQVHKGVAGDAARTIFQGKFEVERAAQKTDAQMTANALLLSESAQANHKPELEIYADDVECAHGSTCGALDENALFYLRQRGLSERSARALLIEAFAGEAIDGVADDDVRAILEAKITQWLEAAS